MNGIARRQVLKLLGMGAGLAVLPKALAIAPLSGSWKFAHYPSDFEGVLVPEGKPFAAKPIGQTPQGTSVLIRTKKFQPLHYHKEKLEVAYCVAGGGVAKVAGQEIELRPGAGVMIPPMTAHTFVGEMDLVSRFSPQLAGDVVLVKEGTGPSEGQPHAFTFQAPAAPAGKPFGAKPLGNMPLATVVALGIATGQPWHYHKSKDEAMYVVSGEGRIQVETESQTVGPGSMALIPAGAIHQVKGPLQVLSVFTPALAGDVVFL